MAAQVLAKGPLSSALGQYVFLGVGTLFLFAGDGGVSKAASDIAGVALRLVAGGGGVDLLREAALGRNSPGTTPLQQQQQPIVIHSHSPSSRGGDGGWKSAVAQLALATGACWGAYVVLSNYLPDSIKELMPVTRQFFESAVSSLGNGIILVRDALSKQIAALGTKQDELSSKQDRTQESVLGLRDDIGDVRLDIDDIAAAISRCEGSLADAAGRRAYATRGVQLLVQCVGELVRPSNPAAAAELDRFGRAADAGGDGGGRGGWTECPPSPDLSDIGSTASADDRRPPRGARPLVTPGSSKGAMGPPPLTLGMSAPPSTRALRMLQSFNGGGRGDGGGGSRAGSSVHSSPEDEVPRSDHDPVKLEEVSELLRSIRSGGIRPLALS